MLRRIVPPDYLQAQTESLLRGASRYLTRKEERLELYLELDEPLDRTSPVLVDYLEVRIDGLEVVEPANFLEVLAEGRFAEELTESLRLLLVERQLPNRIPSIAFIPDLLRPLAFDLVLGRLPELLPVDSDVRSELERVGPQLREHFVAGDTLEFMKLLTRSIVGPAIEKAIAFVKSELELDRSGRFDVTAAVAEGAGYSDVAELQREIDSSWVGFYQNVNRAQNLAYRRCHCRDDIYGVAVPASRNPLLAVARPGPAAYRRIGIFPGNGNSKPTCRMPWPICRGSCW